MIDVLLEHRFPAGGFHLQTAFTAKASCLALFGPSGSGKSLTLRAIAGLFSPQAGYVRLCGRALFDRARGLDVPARDRRAGYVFQDYALFPHLTVRGNIAFSLRHGAGGIGGGAPAAPAGARRRFPWWPGAWPARERSVRQRVDDLLEGFEIASLADMYPAQISGGQRQRVALARALAGGPELLLLDEPFAALDPLLRGRVRLQCKEWMRRSGIPSILITHDPADVAVLADRMTLYADGRAGECLAVDRLDPAGLPEDDPLRAVAAART